MIIYGSYDFTCTLTHIKKFLNVSQHNVDFKTNKNGIYTIAIICLLLY